MTLRLIEGKSRKQFYEAVGEADFFPYEQIIKSGEEGPQLMPFFASLYNNSTGTFTRADRNMAVNGSATPVRFSLPVPIGQIWSMANFLFLIQDEKSIDASGWGNNGGLDLTNGITMGATADGVDYDFTPIPLVNHTDLGSIGGEFKMNDWGQGSDFLTLYIRLSQYVGTRLRLNGSKGDTFWIQINDDLTYLIAQRCMCNGVIESTYLG